MRPTLVDAPPVTLDWRAVQEYAWSAPDAVVLGWRGYRHEGVPEDEARRLEAAGATIMARSLHRRDIEVASLCESLRVYIQGSERVQAAAFYALQPGISGLGNHHDSGQNLFIYQLDGQRKVILGHRLDPGGRDTVRTLEDINEAVRFELELGDVLFVPSWTPHRVETLSRSLGLTVSIWDPGS